MNNVICPWCRSDSINARLYGNRLRLKCTTCGMDGFVAKLPKNIELSDVINEDPSYQKESANVKV